MLSLKWAHKKCVAEVVWIRAKYSHMFMKIPWWNMLLCVFTQNKKKNDLNDIQIKAWVQRELNCTMSFG